tara:strand:+ start:1125 stop:1445 length:321 start_codon:yes stop_codon:yes gene_type:complete
LATKSTCECGLFATLSRPDALIRPEVAPLEPRLMRDGRRDDEFWASSESSPSSTHVWWRRAGLRISIWRKTERRSWYESCGFCSCISSRCRPEMRRMTESSTAVAV